MGKKLGGGKGGLCKKTNKHEGGGEKSKVYEAEGGGKLCEGNSAKG